MEGISGELITNTAKQFGHKNVYYVPDKTKIPELLANLCKNGDIVITLGAGDIWKFGNQFVEILKSKTK
jgi:UDP-N-acetylmuramate--alanine ligase